MALRPVLKACAAALAVALLAAACSGTGGSRSGGDATTTTSPADADYPLDDQLHLNQIQVLGTHNSYHVEAAPDLLSVLRAFDPALADSLQYGHPPLDEQFDDGIRQIELDVFADPDGGLYAKRAGLATVGRPTASGLPELDDPGFKVLHVQDIDFDTTCLTFVACLTTVRQWSEAHPGHVPIMIQVEAKADAIPDPANLGFVVPHPIGAPELDALDAEIRSVFPPDEIVTPDEVRGQHATLEEAVLAGDWPTLGDSRGKVLFTLDNEDTVRDAYVAGHPSLQGRVLFTSSPPGTPEAAFVKRNDPLSDTDIADLVRRGYVVRTRADADTVQARTGDTTMRDAALRSGAQWVSTDYPEPDPRFTDYSVTIPGGTPARCNPVAAPPDCTPADVENPAHLSSR